MHIGFVSHFAPAMLVEWLDPASQEKLSLVKGRSNTPLANLIPVLLRRGHRISLFAAEKSVRPHVHFHGPNLDIHIVSHRRRMVCALADGFRLERRALVEAIMGPAPLTMDSEPNSIKGRARPDILHAHWTQNGHALAALDTGLPCVVTAHDAALTCAWLSRGYRPDRVVAFFASLLITWLVARRAKHMIAVAPYVAEHLRRYFRYQGELRVIPNVINSDDLPPKVSRTEEELLHRPVFAAIGLWSRLKNFKRLLEAFPLVRRALPEARLLLFGRGLEPGGPAEKWALRHACSDKVAFRGWVDYAVICRELAENVDALVHPSLTEGHCMTLCEAMAMGVPVIAGDVGGVAWTLDDGQAGRLTDVRNPVAIADAMVAMIRDAGQRQAATQNAEHSVRKRFNADCVAGLHEVYYQNILYGSGRANT